MQYIPDHQHASREASRQDDYKSPILVMFQIHKKLLRCDANCETDLDKRRKETAPEDPA